MVTYEQAVGLAQQYFPNATEQEIKQVYQEIVSKSPDITLEQLHAMLPALAEKMGNPNDQNSQVNLQALNKVGE